MQVKDLEAGSSIEVIELVVKNVGQGKLGKPPGNIPYQHTWLTDGTGDIRFTLFGDDVNKLQEGQKIEVISSYVKEYPVGSGKLQLALSRDGGAWQTISGQGTVTRSDDIVPAPIQIVNSDAKDERISKLACLKAAAEFHATREATDAMVVITATRWYDWVMAEDALPKNLPKPKSTEDAEEESPQVAPEMAAKKESKVESGGGALATKLELIAAAGTKEAAGWTGPPTKDLVKKFAAIMNGILGGDEQRYAWTRWTYGAPTGSSKEVTGAKLQAVLDLLQSTYTNKKWIPTKEKAVESIKAMYQEALKESEVGPPPQEEPGDL